MKPMMNKSLGVIVAVDGNVSQVGMYSMSNDSEILWRGEILAGPKVGALLTVLQNDVKIIAKVKKLWTNKILLKVLNLIIDIIKIRLIE